MSNLRTVLKKLIESINEPGCADSRAALQNR